MAHSKSALKRWRQSLERRERNRSVKSRIRTFLNRANAGIESDPANAEPAVREAVSALDAAAQKGVIHANAAARAKSRLLKRYNLSVASSVAAAAGSAATEEPEQKPARRRRSTSSDKSQSKPASRRTRKSS